MAGRQLPAGQSSGSQQKEIISGGKSIRWENDPGCSQHTIAGTKAQIVKALPGPKTGPEG